MNQGEKMKRLDNFLSHLIFITIILCIIAISSWFISLVHLNDDEFIVMATEKYNISEREAEICINSKVRITCIHELHEQRIQNQLNEVS